MWTEAVTTMRRADIDAGPPGLFTLYPSPTITINTMSQVHTISHNILVYLYYFPDVDLSKKLAALVSDAPMSRSHRSHGREDYRLAELEALLPCLSDLATCPPVEIFDLPLPRSTKESLSYRFCTKK
jgi:hypothetical protein